MSKLTKEKIQQWEQERSLLMEERQKLYDSDLYSNIIELSKKIAKITRKISVYKKRK